MRYAILLALFLSGCSSLQDPTAPYGAPIPPERLYWPQKVDKMATPSGTVYIIHGKK